MNVLEHSVLNNTIENWFIAGGIAIVGFLILHIAAKVLAHTFTALDGKLPGDFAKVLAEMFRTTKRWILFVVSLYAGIRMLSLPTTVASSLRYMTIVLVGIQIGIWSSFLVNKLVSEYFISRTNKDEVPSGIAVATLIARIIVWAFIVLIVLDNLGFNITTLVAGLGVGGIAIAMASQNILGDLFASLSILLDKPFKVGEFIVVGDMLGSVENIGLKTTRLRSLGGEQLVFSNNDLLSSRIRNYKRMEERRVVFTIGVEYSTSHDKLRRVPSMIKQIVESVDFTRFDRSHFMSYGDFSLNFETVYYILSPDYTMYANAQQEINLTLFKKFEEEGIVFAFPSYTVYIGKDEKRKLKMQFLGIDTNDTSQSKHI